MVHGTHVECQQASGRPWTCDTTQLVLLVPPRLLCCWPGVPGWPLAPGAGHPGRVPQLSQGPIRHAHHGRPHGRPHQVRHACHHVSCHQVRHACHHLSCHAMGQASRSGRASRQGSVGHIPASLLQFVLVCMFTLWWVSQYFTWCSTRKVFCFVFP